MLIEDVTRALVRIISICIRLVGPMAEEGDLVLTHGSWIDVRKFVTANCSGLRCVSVASLSEIVSNESGFLLPLPLPLLLPLLLPLVFVFVLVLVLLFTARVPPIVPCYDKSAINFRSRHWLGLNTATIV